MKDHEAKHHPPILETVEPSAMIDTSISDDEKDDIFLSKGVARVWHPSFKLLGCHVRK